MLGYREKMVCMCSFSIQLPVGLPVAVFGFEICALSTHLRCNYGFTVQVDTVTRSR